MGSEFAKAVFTIIILAMIYFVIIRAAVKSAMKDVLRETGILKWLEENSGQ